MNFKHINFALILIASIFFISCNSETEADNKTDSIELLKDSNKQQKIDSLNLNVDTSSNLKKSKADFKLSKYICPQGDSEGNLNKPGICPVCEMELIENPDFIDKNSNKK